MSVFRDRTIWTMVVAFTLAATVLLWYQGRSQSDLLESMLLHDAVLYTTAMREFRALYTSEVVASVAGHGVEVSHDYKSKPGAIPLPATLSMELGNRLAQTEAGGSMRLYSPLPFPWREATGGLVDEFERNAWEALSSPGAPTEYYEFSNVDGRRVLRYATADVMQAPCVSCHNTHPQTPQTGWQVGDVRGVLEVALPLDAVLAEASASFTESAFVVAGLVGLGLFSVLVVTIGLRRTSIELEQRVVARTTDLERSESKFRRIFDTMADGYYVARLSDGLILNANPAAARILGYPDVESLLQQKTPDLYAHKQDREKVLAAMRKEQAFHNLEIELLRLDGSLATIVMSGRVLPGEDDESACVEASFMDISERKAFERELAEARDTAEQANQAKSAFLANMSHELRTPMNAIIGYSEMLMEESLEEGRQQTAADLEKIQASGMYLLALINDILDVSKIEAGKMELLLEDFDIADLMADVVATAEPLMTKNDNKLVTQLSDELGTMRGDQQKVRQAILNLMSNAAKFTKHGAVKLVGTPQKAGEQSWLRIDVIDSGIGIAPDKLEHIFNEFSQEQDTTSRDYGGTGLGLSISRHLCHMMGGDLTVVSQLGQGSTFTMTLPTRVQTGSPTIELDTDDIHKSRTSNPLVLVVDDDQQALDLLSRTLQHAGLRVITANGGSEVVELARTLRPMAITLDVKMPGMDGWEVLQALKDDPDTCDIPVVMVTMTDDRQKGYTLGATEFLTKPVERSALLQILQRYTPDDSQRYALVVDDLSDNRDVLRMALEREGWLVGEAENGRVALSLLEDRRPDLILLDLMMPVMDGFEFVIEMRKREAARDIPIVVVTAKNITSEERQVLNGNVIGLVHKLGLDQASLLSQVREQIASVGERHN